MQETMKNYEKIPLCIWFTKYCHGLVDNTPHLFLLPSVKFPHLLFKLTLNFKHIIIIHL